MSLRRAGGSESRSTGARRLQYDSVRDESLKFPNRAGSIPEILRGPDARHPEGWMDVRAYIGP